MSWPQVRILPGAPCDMARTSTDSPALTGFGSMRFAPSTPLVRWIRRSL